MPNTTDVAANKPRFVLFDSSSFLNKNAMNVGNTGKRQGAKLADRPKKNELIRKAVSTISNGMVPSS